MKTGVHFQLVPEHSLLPLVEGNLERDFVRFKVFSKVLVKHSGFVGVGKAARTKVLYDLERFVRGVLRVPVRTTHAASLLPYASNLFKLDLAARLRFRLSTLRQLPCHNVANLLVESRGR